MPPLIGIGVGIPFSSSRGAGVSAPVATFTSTFTNGTATPSVGTGTYTYSRLLATETITDFEGLVKETKIDEIGFDGQRRVEDLSTGLVTELNIPVVSGNEYQVTIQGGSGDTAVCSDAFTGTLTADGSNRISWNSGTPKTASTATLDITVTGTLTELLVEDVTGQAVQVPSEQIVGTEHGTGVSNVMYKNYANGGSVSAGGVVTDLAGAAFTIGTVNKGVNAWEARTNYLEYANDITSTWLKTSAGTVVTADAILSPDGSVNGDNIATATGNAAYGVYQAYTYTAEIYTFSVYGKSGSYDHLAIDVTNGGVVGAVFDLSDGGVEFVHASLTAKTEDAGNGWWRCSITGLMSAVSSFPEVYLNGSTTAMQRTWVPTQVEDLYVWGLQLEKGAFISPLIPTGASTETRNADDLVYDSANYTEAGWFLTDFLVTQDQLDNFANTPTVFELTSTAGTEYLLVQIGAADEIHLITKGSSGPTSEVFGSITPARYKIACTWDRAAPNMRASINGAASVEVTTTAGDIMQTGDPDEFNIGFSQTAGVAAWNGDILALSLGQAFITDADLESESTI